MSETWLDDMPHTRDEMLMERQRLLDRKLAHPTPRITVEEERRLDVIRYGLDVLELRDRRETELLAANNAMLERARTAEAWVDMLTLNRDMLTEEATDAIHAAITDRVFTAMGVSDGDVRSSGGASLAQFVAAIARKHCDNARGKRNAAGGTTIAVIPTDIQIAAAFVLENSKGTTGALAAGPHPRDPKKMVAVAVVPAGSPRS